MARTEMAVCEVCSRIYPATMMLGRICPACARKPQTPKPVDFYSLADDGEQPVRRTCKDCGASFLGHRIARYCPACRARHNKEASARQAEKRRLDKGKPKPAHPVCAICGAQLPKYDTEKGDFVIYHDMTGNIKDIVEAFGHGKE